MNKSSDTDNTELGEVLPKEMACDEHETFDACPVNVAKRQINALISKARIDELKSLRVLVSQEGAGKIYIGGLADGTAITVDDRIKELEGKL